MKSLRIDDEIKEKIAELTERISELRTILDGDELLANRGWAEDTGIRAGKA